MTDCPDLSFTADPVYRARCEQALAHIVAEGPKDWWHLPEEDIAASFDQWMDEHGTDPDTLTILTAMWLAWKRANGYAVVKTFPPGHAGSEN